MPTLIFEDKFDTGGTWDVSAGTPTIGTSPAPPSAANSLQLNAIGEYVYWNIPDSGYTRCVLGVWVYVNAIGTVDTKLFKIDAGPSEGFFHLHPTSPTWEYMIQGFGVPTMVAANGGIPSATAIQTWVWCQVMFDVSANPWQLQGNAHSTVASTTGAATATNLNPGVFLLGNTVGGDTLTVYYGHVKAGVAVDDNDWWSEPTATLSGNTSMLSFIG